MNRLAYSLFFISVVTLHGCSSTEMSVPQALVVDSAGLRIVTYDLSGVTPPRYRVVGEHDLQIGVVDGTSEYAFSRIVDLAVVGEDMIVVSDGGSQQLRVFDSEGQYRHGIGQPGEGPGEFRAAPLIAGAAGDTLFAFDRRGGRVSTFTMAGQLLGTIPVRAGSGNAITSLLRRPDGTYLAQSRWIAPGQEPVFHDLRLELDSVAVEHLAISGEVIDTLRVMADRNRARIVEDRGSGRIGVIQAEPPHTPRAFLGSGGTSVVLARSDEFELEIISEVGSPVTLVRVRGADHPATADEIRAHQEAAIREDLGDQPMDPRTRQLNLGFLPDRLPAFHSAILSGSGDLWVAEAALDGSEGYDWLVFSSTGELRGSVHTPPNVRLFAVRPTYVIGVVTDELDVPFIRRYPLIVPDHERRG